MENESEFESQINGLPTPTATAGFLAGVGVVWSGKQQNTRNLGGLTRTERVGQGATI